MPSFEPFTLDHVQLSPARLRSRLPSVYPLVDQAIADQTFPGCSFAVWAHGRVEALDAAGKQTYAEDAPQIQPDTVYDLASVTKVMATTAMAMLLYERGVLDLDRTLHTVLPEFGNSGDRANVTLRHLLAHSSGLPGYARLFEQAATPESMLAACLALPLEHQPGTHAEYSDIGFILLGKALESLAGETIDAFCRRDVFAKCGMARAGFIPDPHSRSAIPPTEIDTMLRHRVIQGEVQDESCFVLGGASGHAGLFANALDVLRFGVAALRSTHGEGLFQPETMKLFSTRSELPPGSSRALGWDTPSASSNGPSSSGTLFSRDSIGHLGYAGTSLWIDVDANVVIVLLTNRTWPSRDNQNIRTFRPMFHDAIRNDLKV